MTSKARQPRSRKSLSIICAVQKSWRQDKISERPQQIAGQARPELSSARRFASLLGELDNAAALLPAALAEEAEIRGHLQRFRFDPEFRGPAGRVPITAFARLVNVSPQALYKIIGGAHMRYDTRARVAAGIKVILQRGLRWHRRNDTWHPNHDHPNLLLPE